ncbi:MULTISPECIES: DesA family fatty acid desaturase [Chromobacterium]|uniref:Acyl-CoA desaturase n=2 Tax=Chromobacterium TaxID=535 RepID=A0A1W0CG76_9NEIS|nr:MULTISPECIES: fatty acid desaturase [Chromobacterium]AXT45619.1 acyl-CoA desaturase [Chromobacterium rhizoryzae]MBK0414393.1 fatty acid desaturase [Chromobacterium haemolyticum]MBO0415973.1 fatty acid desaturase [Chromobacterium haemolyticum]MBO0499233.1 fatty acid desaturase [Chromobacterium haemolyticum]OQS33764.1 acyl-CoA desaturase [Chromobacterium haemolyticum]
MNWINGVLDLPWWGYIVVALALTHVTIAAVTIFLHRHQAHRALDLHPIPSHFFRFWLWLTTGMVTKQWAAIHRKHHAKCETADDPHSPQVLGIKKVLWEGAELYRGACKDQAIMDKFGHGTPDDWLERNVYTRHSAKGIVLMLLINLVLFGPIGLTIWAVQMIWIPFWAAGVINGIGHFWGYRNFENEDASTNIFPWGILVGGEELHNNHHTFGTSAKLSYKWYEFDIGWMYIRILEILGLAKVRKVAPRLAEDASRPQLDLEHLQAIISNRYAIASRYARELKEVYRSELDKINLPDFSGSKLSRKMKVWLKQDAKDTPETERMQLAALMEHSQVLATVYSMRQELTRLWERSTLSREQLLKELQDWCTRAEASGIAALQRFSISLRQAAMV